METHQICRKRVENHWRCKNVSGDNKLQYCEKHYKKKKEMEEKMKLPSDERFCCLRNNSGWRCKYLRMGHGGGAADNIPKTKFCEKHYKYYSNAYKNKLLQKISGDGEGAGSGPIEHTRGSKRRREMDDEAEILKLGASREYPPADMIIGGRTTASFRRKRKNDERTEGSGEPESWENTKEPLVEFESMERYKSKCIELSVELSKKKMELEKKKIECTKLQGELAEVADAAQCWRKMFSDLESRFLRIENSNSTMAECVESRISKLESLVMSSGKEGSILRFVDSRDSVKIGSQVRGLQNDVTQSDEKERDETSCGEEEYSHVDELKTKEEVLNMYENVEEAGKGWGCSKERPSQHGSPSQDHLEMSKKPFASLVSYDNGGESLGESENSDSSADSKTSLGGLLNMLEIKYKNRIGKKELKWKFEADMLSSFEEDPELNMKAVCTLYRQHTAYTNGLFHYSDVLRATTLAKFLMDGACKGELRKSVKELEKFDSKGVEDCKRLARSYSKQLFSIYRTRKDPFFLPDTTASLGDQTAK